MVLEGQNDDTARIDTSLFDLIFVYGSVGRA